MADPKGINVYTNTRMISRKAVAFDRIETIEAEIFFASPRQGI